MSMLLNTTLLQENVARGAELLDGHCPGWHRKIDLQKLAAYKWYDDVLGQLWGDCYVVGWDELIVSETFSRLYRYDMYTTSMFGFTLSKDVLCDLTRAEEMKVFGALTAEWRVAIWMRLERDEEGSNGTV